jgi:excisionase family DNA binding protein
MSTQHAVPRLLRIHEVASATGIQRWRLYELISRGEGPRVMRLGRTIRVSEVELIRWIERQHTTGQQGEK